ncbi:MAG: hypothetical protein QXP22_02790 [Candidatus Anstonellales archaeon]
MKITTKRGDNGKTELAGKILNKQDKEIKALGLIDELLTQLALAKYETQFKELDKLIDFCYHAMAYINGADVEIRKWQEFFDDICEKGISDNINLFVKPNGRSCYIHVARAKARQAEIAVIEAFGVCELSKAFNRLSDVLFIFAYEYQKAEGALDFFQNDPKKI